MKTGIYLLLWTGHVTESHVPVLGIIRDTGFDGVEDPVFETSDIDHYARHGAILDDLGLDRTAAGLIPDSASSPISIEPASRGRASAPCRRLPFGPLRRSRRWPDLTIEAFSRAVPQLAAATRVWRDFFADPTDVRVEGYRYLKACWEK